MQPLKDAVLQLRRELAEAFETDGSPAILPRPKTGHVSLDLTVALGAGGWMVVEASDSSISSVQTHRLHLELPIEPVSSSHTASSHAVEHGRAMSGTENGLRPEAPTTLLGRLAAVFGPPGFDSSARASVFRECLESLSPDEIRAAIAASGTPVSTTLPQTIRMAAHQIGRLLERGPAGAEQGRELLVKAFTEEEPATLLSLVLREWKAQDDWIDRSGD